MCAARRPSPNRVNYNTKSMSPSPLCSEMVPVFKYAVIYYTKSTFWTIPTKLGLGWARAGPGRFLVPKWGLEKHGFAWKWFRNWRLWDSPRPKWIVWYLGGICVRWFPPKPQQKTVSWGFPPFGGIWGWAAWLSRMLDLFHPYFTVVPLFGVPCQGYMHLDLDP